MLIVGCSGCSSSGKTTIVKLLNSIIQEKDIEHGTDYHTNVIILHEDDFFKTDADVPIDPKRKISNWDCPEALNLDLFKEELRNLKANGDEKLNLLSKDLIHNDNVESLEKFNLDLSFKNKIYLSFKALVEKAELKNQVKKFYIVLVDGFMMFHDDSIIDLFDVKLFFRAPYEVLKERREKRTYKTLEGHWVDPPFYFDEFVYKYYNINHQHLFENSDVEKGSLLSKYLKQINVYENAGSEQDSTIEAILSDILVQLDLSI
ncbi:hypothetical protein QEN19_004305 [Hanseniaspora menglaensis]